MPTKVEKDAITGRHTTGHEWDGIKELNTPLPKWWLYVFYACCFFSLVYVILYPAIPSLSGYTKGILGWSMRTELEENLAEARARQGERLVGIQAASPEEIRGDADLLNFALAGGGAAFADNCAPCHAPGGAGRPGYPVLADDAWLWGGDLEAIENTLHYGIRSGHEEARDSQMPAFGELLEPEQIEAVTAHVLSLSGGAANEAGAEVFAEQCAACHGEAGEGHIAVGGKCG